MSNLALYLISVLVWGSTWFAIEFQLGLVEPEVSIVYRYVGASLLLFGWSFYRRLNLSFGLREHGWFVLMGMFLFGLNYVLAYRAQIYITSALTAIAFSSILWMNILNARLFFGTRTGARTIAGSLLGVAGIVTLFAPQVQNVSLSDTVLLGSILGRGRADHVRFVESVFMPEHGTFDSPTQDSLSLAPELVGQLLVLVVIGDRDGERNELHASPDAMVGVGDDPTLDASITAVKADVFSRQKQSSEQ